MGGEGSGLHSRVAVEVYVSNSLEPCHVELLCDLLQVSAGGASVQPARFYHKAPCQAEQLCITVAIQGHLHHKAKHFVKEVRPAERRHAAKAEEL